MDWKAFAVIFLAIVAAELVLRKITGPSIIAISAKTATGEPATPSTATEWIAKFYPGAITV